jgi:hypothetical protein
MMRTFPRLILDSGGATGARQQNITHDDRLGGENWGITHKTPPERGIG